MCTSTTLTPVVDMDTQALTVMKQIHAQLCQADKKLEHLKALASIRATVKGSSIESALSILDFFGYDNDQVCLKGQMWQARDLKNEYYFPNLAGFLAHQTPPLWFWGGPPTKLKWYSGTLQTLLDDRILYEIKTQGSAAVAKLIGINLEGLANVSASSST